MWKRADGLGEWTAGCGTAKAGCMMCGGKGGWRDGFGWVPCPCAEKREFSPAVKAAIYKTKQPYKACTICGGRGGARVNGRWVKCYCTKTTAAERKLREQMNEIGVAHPSRQATLF